MTYTRKLIAFTGLSIALASLAQMALAFALKESRWNPGPINMEIQLGTASGLIDGSPSWDDCAIAALAEWNANLDGAGVTFSAVRDSTRTPAGNDGASSVFFADDIFGTPFGERTVAVAATWVSIRPGIDERVESDVLFNSAKAFNCYRGPRRLGPTPESSNASDLKRVALHEFGHVLGLDHPDQATPPQTVDAIMNAFVSDLDTLQLDDIRGALTLYGVSVVSIPFPPRDEVLRFFLALENEYRDTLGRSETNEGFVDAEGSAVWFTEWLRYVLNDCPSAEAATRVVLQIEGQGIQPVCGVVTAETFAFPPRDDSLDFLNTLDTFYRDDLGRSVALSHIDLEGKAVWLQEYLRYRVNGCNDQDATSRVFAQIRGGGIAPPCTPPVATLTGTWTGELIGAPITVRLTQTPEGVVTGTWEIPELDFNGVVGPEGEPGMVQADGTFSLRFKVLVGAFSDFFFHGSISEDGSRLTGDLTESGFSGESWTLDRQN